MDLPIIRRFAPWATCFRSRIRSKLGPGATPRYAGLVLGVLVGGLVTGAFVAVHTAATPLAVIDLPVQPDQPPAPATSLLQGTALPPIAPAQSSQPVASGSQSIFGTALAPPMAAATAATFTMPDLSPQTSQARTQASPNRLIIPTIGVNSAWLPLGWLANGVTMDSPPGPGDLGWYTFTAQPGTAGNAVFSGHVDWHTGAPALFAHLAQLRGGDEIDVSRADGKMIQYHVVSSTWYPLYGTPAAPIIATTTTPTVTLISCGGTFDQTTREYDQRLVVRAVGAGS